MEQLQFVFASRIVNGLTIGVAVIGPNAAGKSTLFNLDEPSEGLAPMVVEEIFATLRRLAAQGIPILLVEQNVHRAPERGSVILEGVPSDREALLRAIAV